MKKLFFTLSLLLVTLGASAIPAKKGLWTTRKLADGTEVRVQLKGDEHVHFWEAADGTLYAEGNDHLIKADAESMQAKAMARRAKAEARRAARLPKKGIGDFTHYTGKKKGLVILVNFANMKFKEEHDKALYERICNEEGYTSEEGFVGSVYDYFKAQSYGQFELTFDVVGPYQLPRNYSYYGQNDSQGNDLRPGEMVAAACNAADDDVDFTDYDWDGDGRVDQVLVIYAGQGEADGGASSTVWPHEWELSESDYGKTLHLDDVTIDTYACTNERTANSIAGIGTICHEFSHCLGLPDMYDTQYGGNFGMGAWSLMDYGAYNDNGFCPANYTSFEKYTSGWVEPIELVESQQIDNMKAISEAPEVYMLRNDNYANEYYLVENRQKTGWDAYLPGQGLLVLHVDFDYDIWANNIVNTNVSKYTALSWGVPANDHQRCTIFHANNQKSQYGSSGDTYPYNKRDSLTATSSPAATLYNANTDGTKRMDKALLQITRNDDGTMSFYFRGKAKEEEQHEGTLFYESFNKCNGTGGNDGVWSTSIASSVFTPDNEGWDLTQTKAFGGYQCARFGNSSTAGTVTTPTIQLADGQAVITFKATSWNQDGTALTISASNGAVIEPSVFEMKSFEWTDFKATIKGTGTTKLTFMPAKRFLLDEVLVTVDETDPTVGIKAIDSRDAREASAVYDLMGRKVNGQPSRGLYIVGGKKFFK